MRKISLFVAILAMACVVAGVAGLFARRSGLRVEVSRIDDIPLTVVTRTSHPAGPVVIVAHGFAGSQQMMQPLAFTLAHAGYTAVTFDFAGHGRNPTPLAGGVVDMARSTDALQDELRRIHAFARGLPGAAAGVGLLGHSMAADLVLQYAMKRDDISAVVAISGFGAGVTAAEPRNLLVVYGAWEPKMLTDAGVRMVGLVANEPVRPDVTYGDFARGDARRLALSSGVEHIGVIWSADTGREARDWFNAAFTRAEAGPVDKRGPLLALLFGGLVAIVWPMTALMPKAAHTPLGGGVPWKRFWIVALAPAIATPLLLWKAPTQFLPILLGDYLVVHFAVYAAISALALRLVAPAAFRDIASTRGARLALGLAAAVAAWQILGVGASLDAFVTSFAPSGARWWSIPAMLAGVGPFYIVDEWATRGANAARGAWAATKVAFVGSLLGAVALDPPRLFFLIIILPVIAALFVIHGLTSRWIYARARDPRIAALGHAAALAWAIAVTFPIVR